jgi:hypothetical protein
LASAAVVLAVALVVVLAVVLAGDLVQVVLLTARAGLDTMLQPLPLVAALPRAFPS